MQQFIRHSNHCKVIANVLQFKRSYNLFTLEYKRNFSSNKKPQSVNLTKVVEKWLSEPIEKRVNNMASIQIDRSGLLKPSTYSHSKTLSPEQLAKKSKETELVHILKAIIDVKGPLTVSEFMQRAMTYPQYGYYMKKDVFGVKGDFTTAPEISQMFGELIAIWCIATWQKMGQPSEILIVELGPGRGSLMVDFLRAAKSFPAFYKAIQLHMVEISPVLKALQQTNLQCYSKSNDEDRAQIQDGPVVQWHTDLSTLPPGANLLIAQELFDALPVHQFQYTEKGWRERLIDADYGDGEDHFRFVLSNGATPATRVYIGQEKIFNPESVLSKDAADHKKTLNTSTDETKEIKTAKAQIGDQIEISPMSIAMIQDISKRISDYGGAALIIDYGHDHPSGASLRGIQNHKFVNVLREPGDVDLSIDVDFSTLKRYATAPRTPVNPKGNSLKTDDAPNVKVFGPITQSSLLKNIGIDFRLSNLLENCTTEAEQEYLISGYERLVSEDQMGKIFKAMAITHSDIEVASGFEPIETTEK